MLTRNTILQRLPELRIHVESNNNIAIYDGQNTVSCGVYGLSILDAFSFPRSLADGIEKLQSHISGSLAWVELYSEVSRLYKAGILRDCSGLQAGLRENHSGFDASAIHVAMLNDRSRTASFLA